MGGSRVFSWGGQHGGRYQGKGAAQVWTRHTPRTFPPTHPSVRQYPPLPNAVPDEGNRKAQFSLQKQVHTQIYKIITRIEVNHSKTP